ncbi:transporter substrate-binding domain-containing protein [Roseiarcus sp.]|uniref:transporter substrate-binding domain-containing protein n=1 Tax=Roseiarcus sp. TaxID=1969460 RepID=UPI003F988E6C
MRNARFFANILSATLVALLALAGLPARGAPVNAQSTPSFFDPDLRLDRPTLSGVRAIRFLTADDYPPLNFTLPDGSLTGFNVDIARAICKELGIGCTIQARRWDTLIDSLAGEKGDAVIASIAASNDLRNAVDFSLPYYKTPARFIARKDAAPFAATPTGVAGKTVGVVAGTAHQAYLNTFFPRANAKPFVTLAELESALTSNAIAIAFADGVTFSIWLNGQQASDCCEFRGGPYLESRFFGEGVGIIVRKDDDELRKAFNWALAEIMKNGVYSEIYLKYFPIDFY